VAVAAADKKVYLGLFVGTLFCRARPVRAGSHAETETGRPKSLIFTSFVTPVPSLSSVIPIPISPQSSSSYPSRPFSYTHPLLSWLPKLLINACVFYFFCFLLQIHKMFTASAIEGIYYHAEGATPFRLGCTRRERHFDLCAYPFPCRVSRCSLTCTGNFIIVRALKLKTPSRVADIKPPLTARPTRFSLCRRRVPWGTPVPVRIPLQATRDQGSSRCIGIEDPRS
jgi:hypothetical protein